MSPNDILDNALEVKLITDEAILLGDKLYYCLECNQVSDYYKFGQICQQCELRSLRYEN